MIPSLEAKRRSRILVTGGSRGLGLEICQGLLKEGHTVITTARQSNGETEALAAAFKDQYSFLQADLSHPAQVRTLIQSSGLMQEPLTGFVANAAVGTEGLLTLIPEEDIERSIQTNLLSNIQLTRAVLKGCLAGGTTCSLVYISSVCAHKGFTGLSVYAAAKAGLCGFSKGIAREYGKRGIRSNVILPGFLETEMTQNLQEHALQSIQRRTALKRLGMPSDIWSAVRFLLSSESSYITGSEITIDGGLTS